MKKKDAIKIIKMLRSGQNIYRTTYPGYWVSSFPWQQGSDKLPDNLQEFMDELEPMSEEDRVRIAKFKAEQEAKIKNISW